VGGSPFGKKKGRKKKKVQKVEEKRRKKGKRMTASPLLFTGCFYHEGDAALRDIMCGMEMTTAGTLFRCCGLKSMISGRVFFFFCFCFFFFFFFFFVCFFFVFSLLSLFFQVQETLNNFNLHKVSFHLYGGEKEGKIVHKSLDGGQKLRQGRQ